MTTSIFQGESPPIASTDELTAYFRAGEKPREAWRIGTEHEKLGFYRRSGAPVPYEGERGIGAIMEQIGSRFGWDEVREDGNLIALVRGDASITLEPGGQFELSGAPLFTAHDTCRELDGHLAELREISEPLGVVWLGIGRNPLVTAPEMPWMPKQRYRIMKGYLPTRSASALDMMVGTGTVQTNLDYRDEADMARKMRLGMVLTPFLIALFANSPFAGGRPSGYLSSRAQVWLTMDPDRSGVLAAVFNEEFGYEDYVRYALDTPMFFIHRANRYLDFAGASFREYLANGLDGHRATQRDWELHLTTLFPDVRLKQIIELRMVDVGSRAMICAFAALTRALFYDEAALDQACRLLGRIRPGELVPAQREAARVALRGEVRGRSIRDWWRDLLPIAREGLNHLDARNSSGVNEAHLLDPLQEIVDSGRTQADRLLESWAGSWGREIGPVLWDAELR